MPRKPFPPPKDVLRDLLVSARQSAGVTQIMLAERLGIGQSAVSKVERGIQRLDAVELHRWLGAIGGADFVQFSRELDDRLRQLAEAEKQWRVSTSRTEPKRGAAKPRRSGPA